MQQATWGIMMVGSRTAIAALLMTGACSSVNLPVSTAFPGIVDRPPSARVFVDANGTLYPDGWRERIADSRVEKSGSLLGAASAAERLWLAAEEQRQLASLAKMIAGKRRIFVVVHGFNIGEADAALGFDLVERRISFRPDDALIRLHWDGMLGSGVGMGSIWFPATGYSQVVGIRALRRILNLPVNQDVYLISHSRGASVVLSALGEPPFSSGFRRATERLDFAGTSFLEGPLEDRGNRVHALLLAPAVGYPDFWDRTCETREGDAVCSDPPITPASDGRRCPDYRVFTPQLQSIRYTTNVGDKTLQKYVANLRRYFNATDLGYDVTVGQRLASCFAFSLKGYEIRKTHAHAFTLYAQDPELADMLRDAGVEAR